MISGSEYGNLRLWNMSTYQCVTIINGVYCTSPNSLYRLDKDRLIVGGEESVTIVNIDKCVIETIIKDESIRSVYCFLKLRDDNTIVIGSSKATLCFYDMNTEQCKAIEANNDEEIYDLLSIDDSTFLSCSLSNKIQVWKY